MTALLRIDASARTDASVSRGMADAILSDLNPDTVTVRDLARTPLPQIDANWIDAAFTPEAERTDAHRTTLALSDALVQEVEAADVLLFSTPIYNFGVPAALKAWIDLVARAGRTFRYTADGPVGLLEGKRAVIAIASGGTTIGSEIDFATDYMRHVLGFLGIDDVSVVTVDGALDAPLAA